MSLRTRQVAWRGERAASLHRRRGSHPSSAACRSSPQSVVVTQLRIPAGKKAHSSIRARSRGCRGRRTLGSAASRFRLDGFVQAAAIQSRASRDRTAAAVRSRFARVRAMVASLLERSANISRRAICIRVACAEECAERRITGPLVGRGRRNNLRGSGCVCLVRCPSDQTNAARDDEKRRTRTCPFSVEADHDDSPEGTIACLMPLDFPSAETALA